VADGRRRELSLQGWCLYLCKAGFFLLGWSQVESEARGGHFDPGLTVGRASEGATADNLRLVEGLRTGAGWAYEELIALFQQPVYALAMRLLDDPAESSDVVQEVFLKVFRKIGSFHGKSTLRT